MIHDMPTILGIQNLKFYILANIFIDISFQVEITSNFIWVSKKIFILIYGINHTEKKGSFEFRLLAT